MAHDPLARLALLLDQQADLNLRFSEAVNSLADRQAAELGRLRQEYDGKLGALSNRIESHYKRLSERIEHATDVAAGRDAR